MGPTPHKMWYIKAKKISHAKYFSAVQNVDHTMLKNVWKSPVFGTFLKFLWDHNLRRFYKISIVVCWYKPEYY